MNVSADDQAHMLFYPKFSPNWPIWKFLYHLKFHKKYIELGFKSLSLAFYVKYF